MKENGNEWHDPDSGHDENDDADKNDGEDGKDNKGHDELMANKLPSGSLVFPGPGVPRPQVTSSPDPGTRGTTRAARVEVTPHTVRALIHKPLRSGQGP